MDFYTITLDHYEFMQDMLQETDLKTVYYIEAFTGNRLQWTEWAKDEEERESLIRDAVAAGFTYTVETEVQ